MTGSAAFPPPPALCWCFGWRHIPPTRSINGNLSTLSFIFVKHSVANESLHLIRVSIGHVHVDIGNVMVSLLSFFIIVDYMVLLIIRLTSIIIFGSINIRCWICMNDVLLMISSVKICLLFVVVISTGSSKKSSFRLPRWVFRFWAHANGKFANRALFNQSIQLMKTWTIFEIFKVLD